MTKFYKPSVVEIDGKKIVISAIHDIYNKTNKKQKDKIEEGNRKADTGQIPLRYKYTYKKISRNKSLRAVKYDKYYEMLCEAIDSYILGHYKASIACCGIVSELISSELIKEINKPSCL